MWFTPLRLVARICIPHVWWLSWHRHGHTTAVHARSSLRLRRDSLIFSINFTWSLPAGGSAIDCRSIDWCGRYYGVIIVKVSIPGLCWLWEIIPAHLLSKLWPVSWGGSFPRTSFALLVKGAGRVCTRLPSRFNGASPGSEAVLVLTTWKSRGILTRVSPKTRYRLIQRRQHGLMNTERTWRVERRTRRRVLFMFTKVRMTFVSNNDKITRWCAALRLAG